MAQPLARPEPSELTLRILSAAVILPLAISAIWLGGWAFAIMVLLIAAAMSWELSRLCQAAPGLTIIVSVTFLLTSGLAIYGAFLESIAIAGVGMAVVALLSRISRSEAPFILTAGIVYISAALLSVVWLRVSESGGLGLFFWMMAVVVVTDVGAYFAGRGIGGPKLAPRISPAKTWSGLLGGVLCAALAGAVTVAVRDGDNFVQVMAIAGILAVVAQIGDLVESGVKRHVGVKDSGNLIPGHGGVLDRMDGFLTVAPVTALMTWIAGGSPLEWQ